MDARQMAAMAEATRLTRQGRLVEATALIQQTLASPVVTRQPTDTPSAEEETGGTPDRHPHSPAIAARPRGDTPGAGPSRLDSSPPRSPQPKRIESPPAAPARDSCHEAAFGPV